MKPVEDPLADDALRRLEEAVAFHQRGDLAQVEDDPLRAVLPDGARRMPTQAIEAEADRGSIFAAD